MEREDLKLSNDRQIIILNDVKEDFQRLYDQFRNLEGQIKYLQQENKRLKSKQYKDEELARMKKDYEEMKSDYYRGFPISEKEHNKIQEWIDKQMKKHPGVGGAIGGRFRYEFIPTGIGTSGTIIDGFTDDKFNFQELG